MKRSTKIHPVSSSTSYFTGSAFMGISITTLNSSGSFFPAGTRSKLMFLYTLLKNKWCQDDGSGTAGGSVSVSATIKPDSKSISVGSYHDSPAVKVVTTDATDMRQA